MNHKHPCTKHEPSTWQARKKNASHSRYYLHCPVCKTKAKSPTGLYDLTGYQLWNGQKVNHEQST